MTQDQKTGERIAKVLARAGVASRRDAERLIAAGAVTVNGRVIDSPALDVTPKDRIAVEGRPLPAAEPPRLWLYYKPIGLVTTERDEKGRETVFETLPEDMPRVLSVGRLDLNSEGLLLLTNDGEIKRRLELPSTGWLRRYRVRVNGRPEDTVFEPLRQGIEIEGDRFQPMQVVLDRQQGANAWLTVGLREGKNREIRRAMDAIGLSVNRLIRVSYGPFKLEDLEPGEVREVRPRVLRDQLGLKAEPESTITVARKKGPKTAKGGEDPVPRRHAPKGERDLTEASDPSRSLRAAKPMPLRSGGPKPARPTDGPRPPRPMTSGDDARPARTFRSSAASDDAPRKPRARFGDDRPTPGPRRFDADGERPRKPRSEGFRSHGGPRGEDGEPRPRSQGFRSHERSEGGDKPRNFEGKPGGYRGDNPRQDGDRKPRFDRGEGDSRPPRGEGGFKPRAGGFRSHERSEGGDKPRSFEGKPGGYRGDKPRQDGERKPRFDRGEGDSRPPRGEGGFKPRATGFRSHDRSEGGDKPRSFEGKPGGYRGDKPRQDGERKPRFDRGEGDSRPPRGEGGFKPRAGGFGNRDRSEGGDKPRGFQGKPGGFRGGDKPNRSGPPAGGKRPGGPGGFGKGPRGRKD